MTKTQMYDNFRHQTEDLISAVEAFSDKLPEDGLYTLKSKIRKGILPLAETIKSDLDISFLENVSSILKINASIEEIKHYLQLIQKLKLSEADDIIHQVDNVSHLIYSIYQGRRAS